jgi:hypothetical protein
MVPPPRDDQAAEVPAVSDALSTDNFEYQHTRDGGSTLLD